ncbi:MAG: hypothetical protein JXQ71_17485 [Verrucomicrobia bacterium]|nr:hypothetical protein [Verrucomicrobiota bacterium]
MNAGEAGEAARGSGAAPVRLMTLAPGGMLEYVANNRVLYCLRGVWVRLDLRWEFEPPPAAGDAERAVFRGTRSRIEVRQGAEEGWVPEVYVVPNRSDLKAFVRAALQRRLEALRESAPGLALADRGDRLHVRIPDRLRVGHEAHFGLLTRRFLGYVRHPRAVPAWEKPNLLAKYYVTTEGVKLARASAPAPARGF